MNTLLIYYSVSGNTEWAAQKICDCFKDPDSFRVQTTSQDIIHTINQRFWISLKSLIGIHTSVNSNKINWDKYDQIIIGGPVWIGTVPGPLKAFKRKHNFNNKKIAAFCTSVSGKPYTFFNKIKQLTEIPVLNATLTLKEPYTIPNNNNLYSIESFTKKINKTSLLL